MLSSWIFLLVGYFIFVVLGHWVPWRQLRSRGLTLSRLQYFSSLIEKNIFSYPHNKAVFDVLELIRDHKLDISFQDIEKMTKAGVDVHNVVKAFMLSKTKGIKISSDDLKEWAYSTKNLAEEISARKPGEEIRFADFLGKEKSIAMK